MSDSPLATFSKESVRIHPLTPEYYAANLEILNETIQENHYLARSEVVDSDASEEFLETYLSIPNTVYLTALAKGRVLGHVYALPRLEDLVAHQATIGYVVKQEYRNRGVGTIMVQALMDLILGNSTLKILVAEVVEDNIGSLALLRKFGFEETCRIRGGLKTMGGVTLDMLHFVLYL